VGIFPLICEIQTPDHHSQFKNRQQYSNQQSNYLWLIERTRHFFSCGLDWFRCIEHVKNKSHDLTIKIKSDWKPKLKKKTYKCSVWTMIMRFTRRRVQRIWHDLNCKPKNLFFLSLATKLNRTKENWNRTRILSTTTTTTTKNHKLKQHLLFPVAEHRFLYWDSYELRW
jgi:hypothetical protein